MFDVETTQPNWSAHESTNMACPRPGRPLNGAGLVALVHFNQGVRLHRQGRFVEAIEANRQALELDPHCHQARGNLLAAIHNWSLMLAASGQGVEALPVLAMGLANAPHSRTLRADIDRWLQQAIGSTEFARH
jgi:tetratricopeptide (TPR) repeat protein